MIAADVEREQQRALRGIRSGLLRLKWLAAATRFEIALRRHAWALKAGFNPSQPRDDHGRWTDSGGNAGAGHATELSAASKKAELIRKFGAWTARKFISQYCLGSINRQFPGEFENATISEIWDVARGGDARARTCLKLLKEPRFRK